MQTKYRHITTMFLQIFNLGPKYLFFAEFFYPFFALKQEITKIKHLMGEMYYSSKENTL